MEPSTNLITTACLARRWHTTEQAIYAARYRGLCPRAIRIGRRLLFRLEDIEAWEETRYERPAGPELGDTVSCARCRSRCHRSHPGCQLEGAASRRART